MGKPPAHPLPPPHRVSAHAHAHLACKKAGGPGGGSLAPDLAPVWRQVCSLKTKLSTEFICRTDRRTQLTTAHRQADTTDARARAAAKTHPAPCTATMHSLSNEQHSHPHSSLAHSSPHARWMNQAATRNMQRQQRGVSFAPRPVFFYGPCSARSTWHLAGPPGHLDLAPGRQT
eukprot:scaffold1518_cov109-Isochrysis_galbana.AAC.2